MAKRASSQLTTFGLRKEEAMVTLLGDAQDQLTLAMAGAGSAGSYLPLAGGTMTGNILPTPDATISLGDTSHRWYRIHLYEVADSAGARLSFPTNGSASYNFYRDASSDSATTVAHIFETASALNTSGAKLVSFRNAGVEKAGINRLGAFFSVSSVSTPALYPYASTGISMYPMVPDGASAVGLTVDNLTTLSTAGARLLSLKNNGTEKAYFDKDGTATAYGYINTNGTFSSTRTDSALFINSYNADTANAPAVIVDSPTGMTASGTKLLSIRNAGTEKAYFDKDGMLVVGTTLVAQNTITVGALYTNIWGAKTDNSPSTINTWVADGSNAVGLTINQGHALSTSGAKLVSILNNSVEKFYISKDGDVYVRGTLLGSASPATTSAVGTVRLNVTPGDANNPIVLTLNTSNIFSTGAYAGITTASSSLPLTFYMGGTYSNEMDFADSVGNVKMYLTSGGTLGIPSGANAILFSQAAASIMFNYYTQALASNASGLTINSSQVLTAGNWSSYVSGFWSSSNDGTGSGLDADLLDGMQTSASGDRYGVVPFVAADGVMEVGRYLDFHEADADTGDYSHRVGCTSGVLAFSGAVTIGNGLAVTNAITATGNVTAYYSDRRLKRDIHPIPGALAKLDRLRGVEWAWDEMACFRAGFKPDTATDYGFVAQELEYVLPNAVGPNGDFLAVKASNQGVLAVAVEAVKELRHEVELLRARVAELERR